MEEAAGVEPLPPGIMADDAAVSMETTNGGRTDELEDPGTPLENEAQDGAGAVGNGTGDDAAVGESAEADLGADGEPQQEEDDDEDDDIEITIGDIKSNVTFRPGQGAGRGGAVGAKPTSKLDIDTTAMLNGAPIFDADLSSLEDKPWRKPGADLTDYFNYGFTEETWLIYCERQKKLRTEFATAAQANKAYFSQPIVIAGTQGAQMPVPTLENRKMVMHSQPTQVINLVPPTQRQEQTQQILRTVVPAVPSAIKPPPTVTQVKAAAVLTPAVPAPSEHVTSLFDNPAALYDSEPGSPGTPPPRSGSDHEDSNPPPITPRTAVPPQLAGTSMANTAPSMSMAELNKITSTAPPTSFLNLSVPPPRVLPPTNLPPPMARFGPPPMFSTMPPPHFGNPPPTNIPPPGFANPPPPGMPPHQFASGPFGYPPPMRPHMQPNRFGPPQGGYGGFDQQQNVSRADAHSPASYSDRSSDGGDDRNDSRDRFEPRFPPGGGAPPATRPKVEHRRSRSPYSSSRYSSKYSHGHSSSRGHRSRSPVDRDGDKDRDRSSRRGRDDDDGSKKKRSRREESSASDKKKSSSSKSSRDDGHSSSKKRKRSKDRKDDEKSSRH